MAAIFSGAGNLTVDEVPALWGIANETDQEREKTVEAIRQGLADVDAGRTRPFEDFDREFRAKRGLPSRAWPVARVRQAKEKRT